MKIAYLHVFEEESKKWISIAFCVRLSCARAWCCSPYGNYYESSTLYCVVWKLDAFYKCNEFVFSVHLRVH